MNIISERIFQLLGERGMTAYQLSKDTGITSGNITEWKKERSVPSAAAVAKLAGYFNVTADYLLGRTDDPHAYETTVDIHEETQGRVIRLQPQVMSLNLEMESPTMREAVEVLKDMTDEERAAVIEVAKVIKKHQKPDAEA